MCRAIAAEGKPSTLVLSEQGRIEGEIVEPCGYQRTVVGPVRANTPELQTKANVTGDIYYHTVEMQLGAVVQGRLVHHSKSIGKVVPLKPVSVEKVLT
jgi:cytoskeletal protein CcmA (bactofilin family)